MDETTRPYIEKAAATVQPYSDAATAKAKELMDRIEVSSFSLDGPKTHAQGHPLPAVGGAGVPAPSAGDPLVKGDVAKGPESTAASVAQYGSGIMEQITVRSA